VKHKQLAITSIVKQLQHWHLCLYTIQ